MGNLQATIRKRKKLFFVTLAFYRQDLHFLTATRAWFFAFTDWAMRSSCIPRVLLAFNLIVQETERAKKAAAASITHSLGRKKSQTALRNVLLSKHPPQGISLTIFTGRKFSHQGKSATRSVSLHEQKIFLCNMTCLSEGSHLDTVGSCCCFNLEDYLLLIPPWSRLLNYFFFPAFLFGKAMHYTATKDMRHSW